MSPPWGQEDQPDYELESVAYEFNYMTDAGSMNLNVNGSVTPVDFSWTPATYDYIVSGIAITIVDNGSFGWNEFGTLAELSNGLLITMQSGGGAYTIANMKNNIEVYETFNYQKYGGSGDGISGSQIGGTFQFLKKVSLQSGSSDYIRATIRDNLSGLTAMNIGVRAYRIIS